MPPGCVPHRRIRRRVSTRARRSRPRRTRGMSRGTSRATSRAVERVAARRGRRAREVGRSVRGGNDRAGRARATRDADARAVRPSRGDGSVASRDARAALLEACGGTYRGALARAEDRAAIAEARGRLERFADASAGIDFDVLDGRWRLVYTNAADVLGLLAASRMFGTPAVGDIFQSFRCANGRNEGITNEIRLSVPFLLSEAKRGEPGGVGLRVQASYEDAGRRRLRLTFQEATVSEINISPLAETLLAPAILPRSSLNHQALMFIKELELKFPLRGALTSMGGGEPSRGAAVGTYHLTYCDEEVLVGHAAAGGVYIFTRA